MSIFNLNKAKKSTSTLELTAGIRKVFLKDVVTKTLESGDTDQQILEFKFAGRDGDEGFYSETFFEGTFDRDGKFNTDLSDEDFEKSFNRNFEKLRGFIDKFVVVEELPEAKDFKGLCEGIVKLFNTDKSWENVEAEIKLVYTTKDKLVSPAFGYLSTTIEKETLRINPKNKYDKVVKTLVPDVNKAFGSIADDDSDSKDEDDDLM